MKYIGNGLSVLYSENETRVYYCATSKDSTQARIIELFGRCGEYISTVTGKYLDDFEDCAVYMAECRIKPSKEFSIKFQKTKHTNSMWLYGVNLRLCQNKPTLPAFTSINFQKVNEILKEAKIPISENAEKCKTFLQSYGGTFNYTDSPFKNKVPNSQMMMKMLETGYFNNLGETGKHMSKCFSNFVPFLSKDDMENKNIPDSGLVQVNNMHSSEMLILKDYIDQRFTELESRLGRCEQKIKDFEAKQNEKLDCIISLLNKLSS